MRTDEGRLAVGWLLVEDIVMVVVLVVLPGLAGWLGGFMYDFFRVLPLTFGSLSRDVALLVFGTGVGLGIVGSWVSVRTYLIK